MKFLHMFAKMENGDFSNKNDQPYVEIKKLYKYDVRLLQRTATEDVIGTSISKDGKYTPWPTKQTITRSYVAIVCEDHDNIYFVTPQSEEVKTRGDINELREFIPELMKFMARAADGSIIRCWKDGQWVMELE